MNKVEVLSPAGDFECLESAVKFGRRRPLHKGRNRRWGYFHNHRAVLLDNNITNL